MDLLNDQYYYSYSLLVLSYISLFNSNHYQLALIIRLYVLFCYRYWILSFGSLTRATLPDADGRAKVGHH